MTSDHFEPSGVSLSSCLALRGRLSDGSADGGRSGRQVPVDLISMVEGGSGWAPTLLPIGHGV